VRIAVVGGYGLGISVQLGRFPAEGETVHGGGISEGPGGKGSNQAIAASILGATVSLLSAVGRDRNGDDAFALWDKYKVDSSHVARVDLPTMVGVILVETDGNNRIVISPGSLDELGPGNVDSFAPSIENADVLLVSLEIPIGVATRAMEIARAAGTMTVLNPAPFVELPGHVWDLVDVVTPNASELSAITGLAPSSTPESAVAELRKFYQGRICVTLGEDGALAAEGTRITHVKAPPVDHVVDTTGAGDIFNATVSVCLAMGLPLVDSTRIACRAGAHSVAYPGVIAGMPSRSDLGIPS
jgi:ribokinase